MQIHIYIYKYAFIYLGVPALVQGIRIETCIMHAFSPRSEVRYCQPNFVEFAQLGCPQTIAGVLLTVFFCKTPQHKMQTLTLTSAKPATMR